jgi:hypothetical protein
VALKQFLILGALVFSHLLMPVALSLLDYQYLHRTYNITPLQGTLTYNPSIKEDV